MPTRGPILVTGGAGFIGANLVRRLRADDSDVHVILRDEKTAWRLRGITDEITIHRGDMRDEQRIRDIVEQVQPEYVYHMATFGAYPKQSDMKNIIEADIIGSLNLFCALEKCTTLKRVINAGTSSEYGPKQGPMREIDVLEPIVPYGVAKAAQTLFAQLFARERHLPVVTLRLFAIYGPFEAPGRLIADIMCALVRSAPLELSSPSPTRDFIYIGDTIQAMLLAARAERASGEVLNIGSGVEYTVGEVVERAMNVAGRSVPLRWGNEEKRRAYDTTRWVADISKAKSILGWVPTRTLDEGLRTTFDWYNQHMDLYNHDTTNTH